MTSATPPKSIDVVVAGTLAPTVGGIAAAIDDQVASLRAAGLRVHVVNTGRRRRTRPGRAGFENITSAASDARRLRKETRGVGASLVDMHVVGAPLLPMLRAVALAAAARASRARVVVHLHGFDLAAAVKDPPPGFRLALRALGRLASHIVVLDRDLAGALQAECPVCRVVAIPNCVTRSVEQTVRHPSSPDETRIAFVGTVGARKGVADLLAAMRMLDEHVTCDIVGGGAEEGTGAFDQIVASAADLRVTGRATFHGELDRSAARALLEGADIFVLPSRAEGMPVALLEAMASGLPVVVTDVGSMGALVRGAGCGVVIAPGDVAALAGAVNELIGDPARRQALGEAGRRVVERDHDCGNTVSRLLEVYLEATPGGR